MRAAKRKSATGRPSLIVALVMLIASATASAASLSETRVMGFSSYGQTRISEASELRLNLRRGCRGYSYDLAIGSPYGAREGAGRTVEDFLPEAQRRIAETRARYGFTEASDDIVLSAANRRGWLEHHERWGGHTLDRHVGKTDIELITRLQSSPRIRGASTFLDQATAESVIARTIRSNRPTVSAWLRNAAPGSRLRLNYTGQDVIGRGIFRGESLVLPRTNARIILESAGRGKYHVLTAFPE